MSTLSGEVETALELVDIQDIAFIPLSGSCGSTGLVDWMIRSKVVKSDLQVQIGHVLILLIILFICSFVLVISSFPLLCRLSASPGHSLPMLLVLL